MALLSRPRIQAITEPMALHTQSFRPAQAEIPAGHTIIAGDNVVTVSDATGFVTGDLVVVSDVTAGGTSSKNGYFRITAMNGADITITLMPRPGGEVMGAVFAAGSTEITGQTRLPNIPDNALEGDITVSMTTEFFTALADPLHPMNPLATFLSSGVPLAYAAVKLPSSLDIDLIYQMGRPLQHAGNVALHCRPDLLNTRLFSHTPLELAPMFYVEYR